MNLRRICSILVAAIALSIGIAFAQGMAGMNMGGQINPDSMKEGEMDAMSMDTMHDMHMGHDMSMGNMALHMAYTPLRPANEADTERADKIAAQLKVILAKYQDYHAAEAAGFKPFHPEIKQMKVVHFTKSWYAIKAIFVFNPDEPTSLLYERTGDGGYKLIGAMYTDRRDASEDQLNERVPLSVARWHRHINFCFPQKGADPATVDWTKFGMNGSIASKAACDAAGGRFYPQIFGWMVHVYPWDPNPKLVWAK
jgi:hypothetical protein